MDTVGVLYSVFLTLKQAVTSVTRLGAASILPHICPLLLCFSKLSICVQRVQNFLHGDGINLENSGNYLRRDHSHMSV